jgi:RHS repeat-associated protein
VTHLLNTSGNVIETYRYDAFGEPGIYEADGVTLRSASIVSNRFLFTGREYANLFGFYEYRARAYQPTLGRFMSEDPKLFVRRAGLGVGPADWTFAAHPNEAELNLFRYCGNDPVDFTDPTGLMPDALGAEPEGRDVAPAVVLGHAAVIGALAAPAAEAAVGRAAIAALSRSPTVARVVAAIAAASKGEQARNFSSSSAAKTTLAKFYPENGGFIGATKRTWLMPGQIIDRYGGSGFSRFFSPAGTASWERSLPPGTAGQTLRTFEIVKPFEVEAGKVAGWFNQLGGGTAYKSTLQLEVLLKREIIKEITR